MLAPGFADAVFDGQRVFRALLDALARPGRPVAMPVGLAPPFPLTAELASVALALADPDAPVWLDEALAAADAVGSYLRFHTGAPILREPGRAAFALIADPSRMPAFDAFAVGTDEYPDRSTTIVAALPSLEGGPPLRLAGPGIAGEMVVAPPLSAAFPDAWRANVALFPRGVDLLLVAPGRVLGMPRSTRIVETA